MLYLNHLNIKYKQEETPMEKYIYDPTNGWWYELIGDYYLPCVHSEDPTTKPDCHTPESPVLRFSWETAFPIIFH